MIGGRPCQREPEVLAAIAAGSIPPDVGAHIKQCARCREAAAVSRWMQQLADTSGERAKLPDPGTLWWRGQIARRWEAERRSTAPVESMERAELAAALAVIAVGAVWGLPALWRWLTGAAAVNTETVARFALTADPGHLATYVGAALLVLATATFYVLHRTLFTDY
jgi:hypothetical protein